MPTYVTGTHDMLSKMLLSKSVVLRNISNVVEATLNLAANNAKANHGSNAHAVDRYVNQTVNLTRSIFTDSPKVRVDRVEGIFYANMDYASHLEFGTSQMPAFPFMFPALVSVQENFKAGLQVAVKKV